MNDKVFISIIVIVVAGLVGFTILNKDDSRPKERLGQQQQDKGKNHVAGTVNYGTDFPTSGPHNGQPVPWGTYQQEIPNENVLHNMEHGGVVITYSPNLPKDTVTKIEKMFWKPYSTPSFRPGKVVVMPGSNNDKPIILRSWDRILKLNSFDAQKMMDYYSTNVNKSPEPFAL